MTSSSTATLFFYTPPTSPPADSPDLYFTPPDSPYDDSLSDSDCDGSFPIPTDAAIDLALDEEGLTTLEKVYLYSRSKAYHHRIFIVHELHHYLDHVSPQEAVEYVLPLLSGLAMDEDDAVKEALAAELIPVIWWFFSVISDDSMNEDVYASSSATVTISVQAFTPILGTLLLNENNRVGILARDALVGFLAKMNKVDEKELGVSTRRRRRPRQPWEPEEEHDEEPLPYIGLFGRRERALFRQEILQQIVIGLGQLGDDDYRQQQSSDHLPEWQGDWSNPYFPPVSYESARRSTASDAHSSSKRSPPSNSPRPDYSPGMELPSKNSSSPSHSSPRRELTSKSSASGTPSIMDNDVMGYYEDQGTLGRIACLSLVAAVTAGGPLDDDTLKSFLDEVERVVHDPYFKVRQAASFALGALAKEIPSELVPRLMPLFDSLRWDAVWIVRHSALFALPAILGCLSPAQRRTVALETVVALSADKNATVRCGVLESLGEVLYTFVDDESGPPEQLIQLFLGRKEDQDVRIGQKQAFTSIQSALLSMKIKAQNHVAPLESFYTQEKRPLICAFNFPAVVLALGGRRWAELHENYLDLVQNQNVNVSRTLAASIGEIAKLIGAHNARRDLVNVWRSFLTSTEADVRVKAVEGLLDLLKVVISREGRGMAREMVNDVRKAWSENIFRGWRERECVQKHLVNWFDVIWRGASSRGVDDGTIGTFRELLLKGLEDNAANVREAAIARLPEIWDLCASRPMIIEAFLASIEDMASSPMSRRRMTFIACQQTIILSLNEERHWLTPLRDNSLRMVAKLVNDEIEGVRIGVARFTALIYRNLLRHSMPAPRLIFEMLHLLSQDASREVRSYVAQMPIEESAKRVGTPPRENKLVRDKMAQAALFSRPPISYIDEAQGETPIDQCHGVCGMDPIDDETSFSTFNGSQGNISVEAYETAGHGQILTISGVYSEPSSPSSYTYSLSATGVAGEQIRVPV